MGAQDLIDEGRDKKNFSKYSTPKVDLLTSKEIVFLSEISNKDISIGGGKGASLAEMYNAKFSVPNAFIVTAGTFKKFIINSGLKDKIMKIISEIDFEDTKQLESKCKGIRELIVNSEIPEGLQNKIYEAYKKLSFKEYDLSSASKHAVDILRAGQELSFVAVRSSATTEDLKDASFAGQQETFLNIKGKNSLLEAVKKCWASLFTARAVYYRNKKGFPQDESFIAVIVQKMISSDKSGVLFTVNPINNNKNELVVEAVFGLGEGIVSGAINPDQYIFDKKKKEIIKQKIGVKKAYFFRDTSGKTLKKSLSEQKQKEKVLSDAEIKKIAEVSMKIEEHYKFAQDIEFAFENGNLFILQSRPITTLEKDFSAKDFDDSGYKLLLEGLPASPGIASGKVKIIFNFEDLDKIIKGDVLVTPMTNPDMVVTMQKCSAIVTNEGGATAHAAIVSREIGVPCVVGTGNATSVLKDSQQITVNGYNGKVYSGKIEGVLSSGELEVIDLKTKTKVKVIVDLPSSAERASKVLPDGVGLMRIEGIIAEKGAHPNYYLQEGKIEDYKEILKEGIRAIAEKFPKKPVWVRSSDIRSDEYSHLKGADSFKESNPMLGWHGIRRSLDQPEILKAELKAVYELAQELNINFGIMFAQIISVEEVKKIKEIASSIGVKLGDGEGKISFGIMIETPASVQIIKELCGEGIDFISFGTNDLTQYTLAIDRNNEKVQKIYDEMNPAVLRQLARVIRICKEKKVETSICGQAGSREEMVKFLFKQGIDSISANIDAVGKIKKLLYKLETGEDFKEPKIPVPSDKKHESAEKLIEESDDLKIEEVSEEETKEKNAVLEMF